MRFLPKFVAKCPLSAHFWPLKVGRDFIKNWSKIAKNCLKMPYFGVFLAFFEQNLMIF